MLKRIPHSGRLARLSSLAAKAGLAGLLALSAPKGAFAAQPFYTDVASFSGTANQIYGTGNGVPYDASVTGVISFNTNLLTTVYETPDLAYYTGGGNIKITINGTATQYQSMDIYVAYNTTDLNNNPASGFAIYWGPNDSDGVVVYDSVNTIRDASLNSLGVMLSEGLTNSLPYQEDAFFGVGFDSSGFNGGQGNLASLSAFVNPPPTYPPPLLPSLDIQCLGGGIRLSWTTNAPKAKLYSSGFMGQGGNWSPVTNAPVVDGSNYSVTLPAVTNAPGRFFCLMSD